jgi:hypothetical protein
LDVSPNINSYWLEVTVTPPSGQTVTRVEAIVNGATTIPLDLTSWGTYAKNQRMDSGATVVFRAWDSQGKSHDSKPVKWP